MNGARELRPQEAVSELGRRMNEINGIADPASRIREYNRLVGEYPNSALAAFNLALDLWQSGQHAEACDAARRAMAIAPELVDQLPSGLAAALRAAPTPAEGLPDRLGQLVAGFRITHRLAEDPRTQLYWAERGPARAYLRILRRSLSQDPAIAKRFIESAKLLQRVSHRGLAAVSDAGMLDDGCAYVLVRPEPGELLSERIWREEPLAPLAPALGAIAEALATLHAQGVAYLSLQPERIQVAVGAGASLQLLDSEHVWASILRLPVPTIANGPVRERVDPVLFMAPEWFSGRAEVGPPADVYALGVLAYLLLCDRPPLPGETIGEVIAAHLNQPPEPVGLAAPGVPAPLGRLIDAMLDKDPDRRPSMASVAEQWEQLFAAPAAPADSAASMAPAAPAATPDLTVGSMLGDYRLVRKLGEGRTGIVFEGYNERLRRHDAIKVIRAELCRSAEDAERSLREVQAANQIAHPGVVSILQQARTPSGQIYTVMELLEGESLRARIEKGPMPVEEVRRLCRQVALAMSATHEHGVIHRDLKPENVIVIPDPDIPGGERTKIVDFGTANLTESASCGRPYVAGTPAYMSPEQLRDTRTVSTKTDVFALGVIMKEMLAGGPAELPASCPGWLAALIRRMQAPDPGTRPDMQQVADRLLKPPARRWLRIGIPAAVVGIAGIAAGISPLRDRSRKVSPPPVASALLTVHTAGPGQGTVTGAGIDCGADCTVRVSPRTIVHLTATAGGGAELDSWSGCESSLGTACTVVMNQDVTVTATFSIASVQPGTGTPADEGASRFSPRSGRVCQLERLRPRDLEGLSLVQLSLLRNAIYACHGHVFQTAALEQYFEALSWYRANPAHDENTTLTRIEMANVSLILDRERALGGPVPAGSWSPAMLQSAY